MKTQMKIMLKTTLKPTLRLVTFLSLYTFSNISHSAMARNFDEPKDPNTPHVSDVSQKETKDAKKIKQKKETVQIIAILGSGDEVQGEIKLPEKITFRHYKNGLLYTKTVGVHNIKTITVTAYREHKVRKTKKNTYVEFEPDDIEITLTNGNKYYINGMFDFLRSFPIDTPDGRTYLYTFFADTYKKGWAGIKSKDRKIHKTMPHPAAVRKIRFLKAVLDR